MLSSRVVWLPFLLSISTFATADPLLAKTLECHDITDGSSGQFNLWKDCNYVAGKGIGNFKQFVVLDFSAASQKEIETFFAKPGEEQFTLSAGIRLYQNDYVKTLNFGNLAKIEIGFNVTPNDKMFEMVGNYELRTIKAPYWTYATKYTGKATNQSLIVNNPLLVWHIQPSPMLRIQGSPALTTPEGVCLFAFVDNSGPITPEPVPSNDKLRHCQNIMGDLILADRELPRDFTVNLGCLSLENVDFGNHWIAAYNPNLKCIDGTESRLVDNPGLCGDKMRKLVNEIQGKKVLDPVMINLERDTEDVEFEIRLDEETCAKNCTRDEAFNPYYLCTAIKEHVGPINVWFKYYGFAQKADFLQSSYAYMAIAHTTLKAVEMPSLERAESLTIMGNSKLTSVKMPSLRRIGALMLMSNPKFTLSKFSKAFGKVEKIKGGLVECYPDKIVTDFLQLRLCTTIIGDLTLTDVDNTYDYLFGIWSIRGCLTVRNTNLTSLHFLEKTILVNCDKQNWIENNPRLCDRGYLVGKKNVIKQSNRKDGCPCVLEDLAKTAPSSVNCSVTHVNEEFDCNLHTAADLVEVRGTLIVKNCPNLEAAFPKLRKIITEDRAAGLVIRESSGLPRVRFLEGIMVGSARDGDFPPRYDAIIEAKMSIEQYLRYKYSFEGEIQLAKPDAGNETCYDLENIPTGCKVFEGDLVIIDDQPNTTTSIETITGCLIVQNGTQLNFLSNLKQVGERCLYANKRKYPTSPSQGFSKTEISEMNEEYCPTRVERERLSKIFKLSMADLSGQARSCAKSCTQMSQGNCDTFHGNLILKSSDYVTHLEVIYGSLLIAGTQKEQIDFPELTAIFSSTAPALTVYNNQELRTLLMPKLANLTVANNGTQLIAVVDNPKLQNLSDFVPANLVDSCVNDPKAVCYLNNEEKERTSVKKERNWEAWILGVFLALMFGVPVVYHFLTFEEREAELEKRERQREERRRQAAKREEREPAKTAKAPSPPPRQTDRIAPSFEPSVYQVLPSIASQKLDTEQQSSSTSKSQLPGLQSMSTLSQKMDTGQQSSSSTVSTSKSQKPANGGHQK